MVCVAIELLLSLEYKTTWTLPLVFEFMVNSVENCWGLQIKKNTFQKTEFSFLLHISLVEEINQKGGLSTFQFYKAYF